jgi:hypothetical protein
MNELSPIGQIFIMEPKPGSKRIRLTPAAPQYGSTAVRQHRSTGPIGAPALPHAAANRNDVHLGGVPMRP